MKYFICVTAFSILLLLILQRTCSTQEILQGDDNSDKTIYQILSEDGDFDVLAKSLTFSPALSEKLKDEEESITLFAARNGAWEAVCLPYNELSPMLQYHAINKTLLKEDLPFYDLIPSMLYLDSLGDNQMLLVSINDENDVHVNEARIIKYNITASNGVIHKIDRLLFPPRPIVKQLEERKSDLKSFLSAVKEGKFEEVLYQPKLSLFAPTEKAFKELDESLMKYLMREESREDLATILKYHVVSEEVVYTTKVTGPKQLKTMLGKNLYLTRDKNTSDVVLNNQIKLIDSNILAENGVVHTIDQVLIPDEFQFVLKKALIGMNATIFVQYLEEYDLDHFISNAKNNLTVFAPTNDAFESVRDSLPNRTNSFKELLRYHILKGPKMLGEFEDGELVNTYLFSPSIGAFQKSKISVKQREEENVDYFINNAYIKNPNHRTANGVLHIVDKVLFPPGRLDEMLDEEYMNTKDFVKEAEIEETLTYSKLTFLVPEEEVWDDLYQPLRDYLNLAQEDTEIQADLQSILKNHIITPVYYSNNITDGLSIATLNQGYNLTFEVEEKNITVKTESVPLGGDKRKRDAKPQATTKKVKVKNLDVLVSNGVIHTIDGLLLPPNFDFNLKKVSKGLGLSDFVKLIDKAKMSVLNDTSNKYTIFVPTNEAFEKANLTTMDSKKLTRLFKMHIVNSELDFSDLRTRAEQSLLIDSALTLDSLGGNSQKLRPQIVGKDMKLTINEAMLIKSDQRGSNGIIHVIDKVLVPPEDIPNEISKHNFTKFYHLLRAAKIQDELKGNSNSPLTVFVPTDNAFHNTSQLLVDYLSLPNSTKDLVNVLRYHQSSSLRYLNSFKHKESIAMRNGNTVTVRFNSNYSRLLSGDSHRVSVNGIPIVDPDVVTRNGVIHAIDGVLLPPTFEWTLVKALMGLNATQFSKAVSHSKDKNLDKLFTGTPPPYTVFVPIDQAFNTSRIRLESILSNSDRLERIVKLHTVNESIEKIEEGKEYFTLLPNHRLVGGKNGECVYVVKGQSKLLNRTLYEAAVHLRTTDHDSFNDEPLPKIIADEEDEDEDENENEEEEEEEENQNEVDDENKKARGGRGERCVRVGQRIQGPKDSVIFLLNEVLSEGGMSRHTIWMIVIAVIVAVVVLVAILLFLFLKKRKKHTYQPVM